MKCLREQAFLSHAPRAAGEARDAPAENYNLRFGIEVMAIYELDGKAPKLGEGAWISDSAQVIGQVELGANASVWCGAVVRGDCEVIRIGRNTNIQDLAVLHADEGVPLVIGDNVSVGHQAMLHGCTVGDGALIGIQAVVMNGAVIGASCLVGAGAVVTEGKSFPERSLILGAPAKAVRTLTDADIANLERAASGYVERGAHFRTHLVRVG
jgi:carbonic anhydrase/acetyltransferase-like protein (isoleucine patch superfamily)